jgi:Carboxypeptidase regulatory-like domain
VIASLVVALMLAQAAQAPQRDRPSTTAAPPAAKISGRVTAADNTPLRRAIVRLTSPSLPVARVVRTDLAGQYVFDTLPAGRFTVRVSKAGYLSLEFGQRRPFEPGRRIDVKAAESLKGVDVILPKAAAISGVVMDDAGEPVQQMWVAAARSGFRDGRRELVSVLQTVTNDIGEFRLTGLAPGDYYVVAKERDARINEFADEPLGFAATFYPGTAVAAEAQPFRLTVGQEIVNVTLPAAVSRTATATGRVVDQAGSPLPRVNVSVVETFASFVGGGVIGGANATADGRFRIGGIRPGRYVLFSRDDKGQTGWLPFESNGVDANDLTIVVGPGSKVAGRLTGETGAPLPSTAGIELRLTAPAETQYSGTAAARIRADGGFEWAPILGEYTVRATRLPPGLWLKAIMRGDTDVTDTPVAVTHGASVENLTVVLGDGAATLSGVTTREGKAEADYTVILFPEARTSDATLVRLVRADRPDHRGAYRLAGIPPGTWLVAAVDFVEDGQWLDPNYLESLRQFAARITLDRGDDKTVNLELKR